MSKNIEDNRVSSDIYSIVDIKKQNLDEHQLNQYLMKNKQKLLNCYYLDASFNKLKKILLQYELFAIKKMNFSNNIISSVINLQNVINITYLDISNNNLEFIPQIYSLAKLEILILNNNKIKTIDLDKFKDLKKLSFLNLNSNKIKFHDYQDFYDNIISLKEKLLDLQKFEFKDNIYYEDAPNNLVENFFSFYQNQILNKDYYAKHKLNVEKTFNSLLEEINQHKTLNDDNICNKIHKLETTIKKYYLDINLIYLEFENFKTELNLITKFIENHDYQKNKNSNSEEDSPEEILNVFDRLIRECDILLEKFDSKDFSEELMKFFVGVIKIKNGILANNIMEFLTHLAKDKNLEHEFINILTEKFCCDSVDNSESQINQFEDLTKNISEEIFGVSSDLLKLPTPDEILTKSGVNMQKILKSNPNLLNSFKMIINEKYEDFYVHIFKVILKNMKYNEVLKTLNIIKKNSNNYEEGIHSYEYYAFEYFELCFSSKAKHKILDSLNKLDLIKLITFALGIFKNYENYMLDQSNFPNEENEKFYLFPVVVFSKIFKAILKFSYFPFINKDIFEEKEEEILIIPETKNAIDLLDKLKISKNNTMKSKESTKKKEQTDNFFKKNEVKKQIDLKDYFDITLKLINKNSKNSDKKNNRLINLNTMNLSQNLWDLILDIKEFSDKHRNLFFKNQLNKENIENFCETNIFLSYLLKIHIILKSSFVEIQNDKHFNDLIKHFKEKCSIFYFKEKISINNKSLINQTVLKTGLNATVNKIHNHEGKVFI